MNVWTSINTARPVERENPVTHDYCEVICAVDFGGVPCCRDVRVYKYGGGHFWHGPHVMDGVVTHWAYLPELPKDNA
jgi:hypothetical protein